MMIMSTNLVQLNAVMTKNVREVLSARERAKIAKCARIQKAIGVNQTDTEFKR